jgi:hypothetical protein
MKNPDINLASPHLAASLIRLYWVTRLSLAFIWLWTAWVSWEIYPQAQSLAWLREIGLSDHTEFWFAASCLLDLLLGLLTLVFVSRKLWIVQIILVLFYSLVIMARLPEFMIHPFAPVIKNLAVLCCLYYLLVIDTKK